MEGTDDQGQGLCGPVSCCSEMIQSETLVVYCCFELGALRSDFLLCLLLGGAAPSKLPTPFLGATKLGPSPTLMGLGSQIV